MNKNMHSIYNVRIEFPVKITAVLFIVSAAAILGFSTAKTEKARGIYVFGTAVGTAAATGISAFYVLQSIIGNTSVSKEGQAQALAFHDEISKRTIDLQKEESQAIVVNRTLKYIGRWNSQEYAKAREIAQETHELFLGKLAKEHNDILRESLKQTPNKKLEITFVLNFFEEISIVISKNLVDEELAKDFFKSILVKYYYLFESFIFDIRKDNSNDNLYRSLGERAVAWKNGENGHN
jgi:Domain of unknown function (DUF4760)